MSRIQHRDALDRMTKIMLFEKVRRYIWQEPSKNMRIKVINANTMALVHQALVGHLKSIFMAKIGLSLLIKVGSKALFRYRVMPIGFGWSSTNAE